MDSFTQRIGYFCLFQKVHLRDCFLDWKCEFTGILAKKSHQKHRKDTNSLEDTFLHPKQFLWTRSCSRASDSALPVSSVRHEQFKNNKKNPQNFTSLSNRADSSCCLSADARHHNQPWWSKHSTRLRRLDNHLCTAAWGSVSNGCLLLF